MSVEISPPPAAVSFQPASRALSKFSWTMRLLLLYLAAITIFGKGPTYIGVGVLYWGEVVLAISLVWTAPRLNRITFRTMNARVVTFLICCFIVLGGVLAIINYPIWGIDTLRDSAIWYYALFYFVGLAIASDRELWTRFTGRWKIFFIVAVVWTSAEYFTNMRLDRLTPELVPTRGPILSSSGLEITQSAGLGCILLLSGFKVKKSLKDICRFLLAVTGLVVVAVLATSRSAKIAVAVALAVSICISIAQGAAGHAFRRRLAVVCAILTVSAVIAAAIGVNLGQALDVQRFEGVSLDHPDDTAEWRADWWAELYDAVMEQNPVFGVGFGINLADFNPEIHDDDALFPVRAPHNFNVTIFARMGIVGACIWGGIVVFGMLLPLWRTITSSTTMEKEEVMRMSFWLIAAIAIWVNSSFSVLMEGPVAGIPFWLILGLISGSPAPAPRRSAVHARRRRATVVRRPARVVSVQPVA